MFIAVLRLIAFIYILLFFGVSRIDLNEVSVLLRFKMRDGNEWKVSAKTGKGKVCGIPTEIVITEFQNKFFIVVTDSGKIGSLVSVSQEKSGSENIYSSRVIFGKDKPEIQALACAFAETCKFPKPVVFGISLIDYSTSSVRHVKNLLATVYEKPPSETEQPCR